MTAHREALEAANKATPCVSDEQCAKPRSMPKAKCYQCTEHNRAAVIAFLRASECSEGMRDIALYNASLIRTKWTEMAGVMADELESGR